MARVVDALPKFGKYPWDKWLNGDVWLIEPSDHPEVDRESIAVQATNRARKSGMRVRTRRAPEGIYIQAWREGGDDG